MGDGDDAARPEDEQQGDQKEHDAFGEARDRIGKP